jgi:inward rectifier potassium channel
VRSSDGKALALRQETPTPPLPDDPRRDLGFGSRVAQQSRSRLLNRDGSFNVVRVGLPFYRTLSAYHALLTISWLRFFGLIALGYLLANLLFGGAYLLCGREALAGTTGRTLGQRALEDFFFSVQTLATIGYGTMSPRSLGANFLVTVEALVGLMGFALATGLLFARVSRPDARIAFSDKAVVAPFREGTALMFRIVNERRNQLTEVRATLTLSRQEGEGPNRARRFHELNLERRRVVFLPLHWVIVHPIDERSPLHGTSAEDFVAADSELLILLSATDETFFQTVHVRSSYKPHEVVWGARFVDMFLPADHGKVGIDLRRLHDVEPLP